MSTEPEFRDPKRARLVEDARAQIAASTAALEKLDAKAFHARERELAAIQRNEAFVARMHVKELRGE